MRMPWLLLATSFPSWIHFASVRDGPGRLWKCFGMLCWPTTEGMKVSGIRKSDFFYSWGSLPCKKYIGWNFCPNFFPTISISKFKKRVFSCCFSASKHFFFSLVGVMQGSLKIAHFGGIGLDVNMPKQMDGFCALFGLASCKWLFGCWIEGARALETSHSTAQQLR